MPRPSDDDASATDDGRDDAERSAVVEPMALAPGLEVGRYVLLRPLAGGGMGTVHLAFDPELDRNVALKLLLPRAQAPRAAGSAEPEPNDRDLLIGEARALARLSHPHVIQVYDVGAWADRVYVALEYVAGQDLRAWQHAGPREIGEVLEVLLAAGEGLRAAHAAGIVHLDVKPTNVLIGSDGVARVADFGLARRARSAAVEGDAPIGTSSTDLGGGRAVGTVGYIAPELFLGEPADARSDQFGFCVTAWEAIGGERPFAGATRAEYRGNLFAQRIAPPRRTLPRRLQRVLRRGLSLRPGARFADMADLLDALRRARHGWARNPWVIGAGSVVVAVAVGAGVRGDRAPLQRCDGGAREFEGSWNDARRRAVTAAIDATGLPFANAAGYAVESLMAGYARAWIDHFDTACAETFVQRSRSEPSHVRAVECLQAQREQFDALAQLFEHADAALVEHAVEAVHGLPAPARCLDEVGDVAESDDALRATSNALAARLAQARAWTHAGRFVPALELAEEVRAAADAAGLSLPAARARLLLGHTAAQVGELERASVALREGVALADAAGADVDRLGGLVDLVYLEGHLAGDAREAHRLATLAGFVVERVDADVDLRVELLVNEAVVLGDEGRLDEALAHYRQALALRSERPGPIDEQLAALCNNIGNVYLARSELAAAVSWFAQAYLMRVALAGPDHPSVADPLVNLGAALGLLGEPAAALAHHRRALAVLERARGPDDGSLRVVLNNIGVVLRDDGDAAGALAAYQRAYRLWRQLDADNPAVGVTLCNIAELHLDAGEAARAHEEYALALALFERTLPAGHAFIGNAWTGLGRARVQLGATAAGVGALRHAIDLLDRVEVTDELRAEPRLALAHALATAAPALARTLAREARALYLGLGKRGVVPVAAIDRWLASWRPRP